MRKVVYCFLLIFSSQVVKSQTPGDDCSGALALCPGNTVHHSNIGATSQFCSTCGDGSMAVGTFCYEVNNSVWYTFTTNSGGGNASVVVSNISCLTGGGRGNEIELTIFSAPTGCTPPFLIEVCTSTEFSSNQTFSLTGLNPNTTYYIHLDGDNTGPGITAPAECDFDILVSGPAVEPVIFTNVINATCSGNDGQITVTSVTGASAPMQYSLNGGPFQPSPAFTGLAAGTYQLTVITGTGCTFQTEVEVPLTGGPQDGMPVVVNANCSMANGSIDLTGVSGGTGPYTYAINGGAPQASSLFTGLNSGMYSITVTDNNGCSFIYENINVPTNGSFTSVIFNVVQPQCPVNTGTVTIVPLGGTAPYTYSLNGGAPQTSNTFSGLAPGTYIVLVFDNSGCLYANNQVVIEPATPDLVPQIFISPQSVTTCQGSEVTFLASYSNGGSSPILQWQINGVNAGTGGTSFTTSALNNGDIVTCVLTSNDPCATTTTAASNPVTVTVIPQVNPSILISPISSTICQGETAVFNSVVTDCATDGTYYWYVNGAMVDSISGVNLAVPLNNNSEVIASFLCNTACANLATSNSVQVDVTQVSADAGPNAVIGVGESVQLNATATGTFQWDPVATMDDPTSLTPVVTPPATTVYTLTVTNNGCTAVDEVTVVVTELIVMPNTFTPNGDGINDFWHITNIEKFPSCKVTIYDRWGQRVYNSTGYSNDNAWDGTYLNKTLPAAAYYYVIELNAANSKEADTYYGWVSIIY